jgi:hypothetical protein
MRPTGDSHRRALSPADKPRDAEAMDVGVASSVDEQLGKHRADAGTKLKPVPTEPEGVEQPRRRG